MRAWIFAFLLLARTAFAQESEQEARAIRNAGIIVTVLGAVMVGIGLPIYLADPGNEGFPSKLFGGIVMGGGGVGVVSGVSIWIYGSYRLQPYLAPAPGGAIAGITLVRF
jgi:hypothetical protein